MTSQQLAARRNAALDRSRADLDRVIGSPQWGWHVESSSDPRVTYSVSPRFTCNCPAGLAGMPCRHAAACWRLARGLGAMRVEVRG